MLYFPLSLHLILSLLEYILCEGKLYLVFEHVDKDLKKYMVAVNGHLHPDLVMVLYSQDHADLSLSLFVVLCASAHSRDQLLSFEWCLASVWVSSRLSSRIY